MSIKKLKLVTVVAVFLFSFFGISLSVHAATLTLDASAGVIGVGQKTTVRVYVDTANKAVNAYSGVITYPSTLLSAATPSMAGSIVTTWAPGGTPTITTAGKIHYEGITFSPGYTGTRGLLFSVTFTAKKAGDAAIKFEEASVLANDGEGTNVLSGSASRSIHIGTTPEQITSLVDEPGVPTAPVITSITHPDSSSWYAESKPQFSFEVPQGTLAVLFALDREVLTTPTIVLGKNIKTYTQKTPLDDGIWYAHLRYKSAQGFGAVSHFKVQIDRTPPSITLSEKKGAETLGTSFHVEMSDNVSGVVSLSYRIDGGEVIPVTLSADGLFTAVFSSPGPHTISVTATDAAGNQGVSVLQHNVLALAKPIIIEYPSELKDGDFLIVRGTTYPNASVHVYIKQAATDSPDDVLYNKKITVPSDSHGDFTFASSDRMRHGVYSIFAVTETIEHAQSDPSDTVTVYVAERFWGRIISYITRTLVVTIPLLVLLIGATYLVIFLRRRLFLVRRSFATRIGETEKEADHDFSLMRASLANEIVLLSKIRSGEQLQQEEVTFLAKMREELDGAENNFMKNLEDIRTKL